MKGYNIMVMQKPEQFDFDNADLWQETIADALRLELKMYYVLDGSETLEAKLFVKDPELLSRLIQRSSKGQLCDYSFRLSVSNLSDNDSAWQKTIPANASENDEYQFTIDLNEVGKGYNCLEAVVVGADGTVLAGPDSQTETSASQAYFAILQQRSAGETTVKTGNADAYLSFVVETVNNMITSSSARLGGQPDGTLFITKRNKLDLLFKSLSYKRNNK